MTDTEFLVDLRGRTERCGQLCFLPSSDCYRLGELSGSESGFTEFRDQKTGNFGCFPTELRAAIDAAEARIARRVAATMENA